VYIIIQTERNYQKMAKCVKCGNDYDKAFEIKMNNQTYIFDSFECAITMLAPRCKHCTCIIIGHGLENDGVVYCCAHCASHEGEEKLVDRV